MTQARSLVFLSLALAAGSTAMAQSADVDPAGPHFPADQVLLDNGFGTTKAALAFDNGGVNPQPGGCSGGQFSAIEAGLTTFGMGWQTTAGNSLADDFTVPAGQNWDLTSVKLLAYQTGSTTAGSITGVTINVVPGASPNGVALPGGGVQTFAMVFSGIYRTDGVTNTNCQRPLMELTVDMTWVPVLPPGQYWITASATGSLTSGPWMPPTVPWDAADNGQQSLASAAFAPMTVGVGGAPADLPFALAGDDGAGGGITSYCTQTKPTSVPACFATLTATNNTLATGVWSSSSIPAAAASSVVGIYIYTDGVGIGQSAFSAGVPFGTLCLSGFKRSAPACAPAVLAAAAGCNAGPMTLAVNCGAGALGIAVGEDVNVQLWHRDPAAAGAANFSNAIFYTVQ
jgi:hypothetical protein